MCTDKKKAVLGDFRAKKASYPSRTACLGLEIFFVNYRLATARHGVRSAKLLNFLFTFKYLLMRKKRIPDASGCLPYYIWCITRKLSYVSRMT